METRTLRLSGEVKEQHSRRSSRFELKMKLRAWGVHQGWYEEIGLGEKNLHRKMMADMVKRQVVARL